jgi:predicted ribosome quality control (RQC) complex YloA/Tae2 family protein
MRIFKFNKFIGESKKDKFPNIKTINVDDFTVLVGRDAKSNDYLSMQMANENDLWFHAKGLPGSHVLIKVKDNLPTPEIIYKVAKIAAKNSKASGTCTVVYCKAKFLSKTSDMKPGQVSVDYTNSQEIEVEI